MSTYDGSQRSHWLGAPTVSLDRSEFERTILARFAHATDAATAYLERLGDRQVAKAQALLPFNAIVFALLTMTDARSVLPKLAMLGALLAVLAALSALASLYTSWGSATEFATAQAEFKRMCRQCYRRGYLLTFALCASALATVIAVLPLLRQVMP